MINAVIIDDNKQIREHEKSCLDRHFPDIKVVGEADGVQSGTELIIKERPKLVLLDIELIDGTGFELLQRVKPYDFALIFITGFHDFAIQAIKFSALDYLVKPINELEFKLAVEHALEVLDRKSMDQQIRNFFDHYEKRAKSKKIVLKTLQEIFLVDIDDISYCQSDSSYTTFYLVSGQRIVVSTPLKSYEELLTDYQFFRPHQSFIVNLNRVAKVDKSDGGFLVLKDGTEIPISQRRKSNLLQILDRL